MRWNEMRWRRRVEDPPRRKTDREVLDEWAARDRRSLRRAFFGMWTAMIVAVLVVNANGTGVQSMMGWFHRINEMLTEFTQWYREVGDSIRANFR